MWWEREGGMKERGGWAGEEEREGVRRKRGREGGEKRYK